MLATLPGYCFLSEVASYRILNQYLCAVIITLEMYAARHSVPLL